MHFLLVHGAWHGGWVFTPLVEALVAEGHTASAPDLPAHGDDHSPPAAARLERYIDAIVAALDAAAEPVILVGHSFGGMVAAGAAGLRPDAVAAAVYVAAYLPAPGDSAATLIAGGRAARIERAMQPDPEAGTVAVGKAAARRLFYPDVPGAEARAALARLRPEPLTPLYDRAGPMPGLARVPSGYLLCTHDRVLPPELQRAMAARGGAVTRELDSAHTPQLSMPVGLAAALREMVLALTPDGPL